MVDAEAIDKILKDENKINTVARAMFQEADVDKSGKINLKEMHILLKRICEDFGLPQPSKDEADEILKELDSDKNGEVDFIEFKKFVIDGKTNETKYKEAQIYK